MIKESLSFYLSSNNQTPTKLPHGFDTTLINKLDKKVKLDF